MKKLFSFLIFVFVLCFSFCFATYTTNTPYTILTNAIGTSSYVVNNDFINYYNNACNYFFNDNLHLSNVNNISNYHYYVVFSGGSSSNGTFTIHYIGVANNELCAYGGSSSYWKYVFRTSAGAVPSGSSLTWYHGSYGVNLSDNTITTSAISTETLTAPAGSPINISTIRPTICNGSTYYFVGTDKSISGYSNLTFASTGYIKEMSNNDVIENFLTSVNSTWTPPVTSSDYFDIYIDRDNLTLLNNGTNSFYKYTNIHFKFSDYFTNNVSSNAKLYFTVINNSLNYSILPTTRSLYGYTDNVYPIELDNTDNLTNGFTLVLYYSLDDGVTLLGGTSYQFYVNANNTNTGMSSTGTDNTISNTGTDDSLPTNVQNTINYTNDVINSGYNDNNSEINYDDATMRGRFSNMFSFFSIAFSWLPEEIIALVKVGFGLAVTFLVLKIIRG